MAKLQLWVRGEWEGEGGREGGREGRVGGREGGRREGEEEAGRGRALALLTFPDKLKKRDGQGGSGGKKKGKKGKKEEIRGFFKTKVRCTRP